MTELTTKQIVGSLKREDLPAEHYRQQMQAITARRAHLKARLESIESRSGAGLRAAIASGDPEQIAALNRESEVIDDELGLLSHAESRASQLGVRAAERETIEAGQRAHKRIGPLTTAATDALAKYEAARQQLRDAVDAIGGANQMIRTLGDRAYLDDAAIGRVADALWPASIVPDERRRGALSGIRRWCAPPPPPNYGEPAPDVAEQMHRNMFARRDS